MTTATPLFSEKEVDCLLVAMLARFGSEAFEKITNMALVQFRNEWFEGDQRVESVLNRDGTLRIPLPVSISSLELRYERLKQKSRS